MRFDDSARSHFGDMHAAITKNFKKYHLFGFTGTPIFAVNSTVQKNAKLRTTEQAFGNQLHAYTIVDQLMIKTFFFLGLIILRQLIFLMILRMKKFGILIEKKFI